MRNVGEARPFKGDELGLKTPWASLGSGRATPPSWTWKTASDSTVRLTAFRKPRSSSRALAAGGCREPDLLREYDGSRWASNTVKLDGFTTLNLKAAWRPTKNLSAEAGVNNVGDENYELDQGFPAAGRMWFANLNYTF